MEMVGTMTWPSHRYLVSLSGQMEGCLEEIEGSLAVFLKLNSRKK